MIKLQKRKRCSKCRKLKPIKEFYKCDDGKRKRKFVYCKECSLEKSRNWYMENKEAHNLRNTNRYKVMRDRIISLLGGKCRKCPVEDKRVLCIDHKDGKGAEDRIKNNGSGALYKILEEIEKGNHNYQLLCLNCNWIKALKNGELKKRF